MFPEKCRPVFEEPIPGRPRTGHFEVLGGLGALPLDRPLLSDRPGRWPFGGDPCHRHLGGRGGEPRRLHVFGPSGEESSRALAMPVPMILVAAMIAIARAADDGKRHDSDSPGYLNLELDGRAFHRAPLLFREDEGTSSPSSVRTGLARRCCCGACSAWCLIPAGPLGRGTFKIGYVPQRLPYIKDVPMSVEDFFALSRASALRFRRRPRRDVRQRSGLPRQLLRHKRIGDLSSGQFQRMLIAWALIGDPQVLLFDEPTTGDRLGGEETVYRPALEASSRAGLTDADRHPRPQRRLRLSTQVLCMNRSRVCYGARSRSAHAREPAASLWRPK